MYNDVWGCAEILPNFGTDSNKASYRVYYFGKTLTFEFEEKITYLHGDASPRF